MFSFGDNQMYCAIGGPPILPNGQPVLNGSIIGAYARPWHERAPPTPLTQYRFQFDMTTLFNQPPPTGAIADPKRR